MTTFDSLPQNIPKEPDSDKARSELLDFLRAVEPTIDNKGIFVSDPDTHPQVIDFIAQHNAAGCFAVTGHAIAAAIRQEVPSASKKQARDRAYTYIRRMVARKGWQKHTLEAISPKGCVVLTGPPGSYNP